jgi:hypothetical protein
MREQHASPTVAEVVGRTARKLRGDRKIELVARAARLAGLNWGTGRIADLEAGRVSPTLPTLIALCWAFSDLLDRPVGLAELFAGDGNVTLMPGVVVPVKLLRSALEGQLADPPIGVALARSGVPMAGLDLKASDIRADKRRRVAEGLPTREILRNPRVRKVERSMLEADYRMAHSVGISAELAADEMEALWGRSFTAERDHRAGPDANPQKRGRISRELKAELQEAVNRGDD